MNIGIHSTKNEKEIRASTMYTDESQPNDEWCVFELHIRGRWGQDDLSFFLPASEKATVLEIARLWNTLSVAKVEVRLDAEAA